MQHPSGPSAGTRQHNLARILHQVHLNGPQSRAALTETTGLNRSTIADLVAELSTHGLVSEQAPETIGRVGRPSPVVAASPHVVALAVNPEVDALEMAAIGLDRSIRVRERIELDAIPTPSEATALIATRVAEWRAGPLADSRVVGTGVAVPGLVRHTDGLVRNAPHLGWTDAPLAGQITAATGIPTVVDNDASLGAHAEHLFGAARGIANLVYLNGGASGIGGGLIVHGSPLAGASGYAGELGQSRVGVAPGGASLVAGGILEDEVNRRRLLDAVGLAAADDATLARALADSATAGRELARQRHILAAALATAINLVNPSAVILGGFLAVIAETDPAELHREVGRLALRESLEGLQIKVAALGADRLLIGAAEAAFAPLLRAPTGAPEE